jgi:hypothetical protein
MRLDGWPAAPAAEVPQDTPEVAQLREELRKAMPEIVPILEMLDRLRPMRELAGRRAAHPPAKMTMKKS